MQYVCACVRVYAQRSDVICIHCARYTRDLRTLAPNKRNKLIFRFFLVANALSCAKHQIKIKYGLMSVRISKQNVNPNVMWVVGRIMWPAWCKVVFCFWLDAGVCSGSNWKKKCFCVPYDVVTVYRFLSFYRTDVKEWSVKTNRHSQ